MLTSAFHVGVIIKINLKAILTAERISINFHSRAMRGLANGGRLLLG